MEKPEKKYYLVSIGEKGNWDVMENPIIRLVCAYSKSDAELKIKKYIKKHCSEDMDTIFEILPCIE